MWFVVPAIVAVGAGIAGFFLGEKKKEEEIYHKLREQYYNCISNAVKAGVNPKEASRICSYTADDITIAKVFILSASLISMGLALYAVAGMKQPKIETKEVKYVSAG